MVFQANKTIRVLDLGFNKIGDAGMLRLGDALKVAFVLFREISSFALLPRPHGFMEFSWNFAFDRITKRCCGLMSAATTQLQSKELSSSLAL